MAGSGAAPKVGVKLGHGRQGKVTAPGDGSTKRWPIPAGDWLPQAVDWWNQVLASPSAATWVEADRPKLERVLWMVDEWWRLTESNRADAMRMADAVRRAEEELYLSPKARASAGIVVDQQRPAPSTEGNARTRLRAVRGDDAVGTG